jgi:hypothetical protein
VESLDEIDQLMSNQRSRFNAVIGAFNNEKCPKIFSEDIIALHGVQRFPGPNILHVFLLETSSSADWFPQQSTESCAWVGFIGKGKSLEEMSLFQGELKNKDIDLWVYRKSNAFMRIINRLSFPVSIFHAPDSSAERMLFILYPNESREHPSHLGLLFSVRKEDGELVYFFLIDELEQEIHLGADDGELDSNYSEERLLQFSMEHHSPKKKIVNFFQPHYVPQFTEIGFEKRRLPAHLLKEILQFYQENEQFQQLEVNVGSVLNQESAPTYLIELPDELGIEIFNVIGPMLEEWTGTMLEPTSLYGIRRYTRGSILNMHVDFMKSHSIAAIVNVAQELEQDWMLEIVDHSGNLHEISMKPGDVLMYESAKTLHGRPKPLEGLHYSNFFVHCRPADPGLWDFDYL